jgi:hypothetical protein
LISDVSYRHRDGRTHRARALAAVVAVLSFASIAAAGCGGGSGGGSSTSTTTTSAGGSTTSQSTTTSSSSTTGTGGGSTTGQVGQAHTTVPQAVNAVLTSADPEKACGSAYVTQHYLEAAYGGKQGCVQGQSSRSAASSLHITQTIPLDTATPPPRAAVELVPDGGLYNGDKITVSLVKEDGSWKVDQLKSNAAVGP